MEPLDQTATVESSRHAAPDDSASASDRAVAHAGARAGDVAKSRFADPATLARMRAAIEHLTTFDRPSASHGELRAASWISDQLAAAGCRTRIERERAVGGYWGPLSILTGLGAVAGLIGLRGHRVSGGLLGVATAAAVWDDVSHGRRWFRKLFLRHRPTWNVVAELGEPDASRTFVFIAHHDAAHSGLIFHPAVMPAIARAFPKLFESMKTSAPVMLPVFLAPALAALGCLTGRRRLTRAGVGLGIGLQAVWADVALRSVVPGANDNLAGVAALIELARRFAADPVDGARVILLSTGSEESNSEGMHGWARRHLPTLDRDCTAITVLESLGSPELILLQGEGMLKMREYPKDRIAQMEESARELGIPLRTDLRFRNATDGIIALRAGFSTAMLGSVTEHKLPSNYHWPSDTAENVTYETIADAVALVDHATRDLASSPRWPCAPTPRAGEWR